MSKDDDLMEALILAIGRAEGYVSKPVMRKRFGKTADAVLKVIKDWDAGAVTNC